MRIIVLTGGLGAGKSTASRYFATRGAHVIDADRIARDVLADGEPAVAEVIFAFGEKVAGATPDSVDREALAKVAFATSKGTRCLNGIVHPIVIERLDRELAQLAEAPTPPSVVAIEVPLLTDAPSIALLADAVVAIEAPVEMRIARAGRRGIEEEDARRRIALQAEDGTRAALATEVIVNDGSEAEFLGKLEEYWQRFASGPKPAERDR